MEKWLHRTEIIVDKSIPYLLLLLLVLIMGELFFAGKIEAYHSYVSAIDWLIIGIFVLDLGFKYVRSKNIPSFFKEYWLEILAVFPAFLVVRMIEEFIRIANLEQAILLSQESLEVGERIGVRANRIHYFGRFIGPLARLPRFFKAFSFYEKPHHFEF